MRGVIVIMVGGIIRSALVVVLIFLCELTVFGTPQRPEIIIYKGQKYQLFHNLPMADYFKKYPDKHPRKDFFVATDLWRGYVATYEIKENQLYIKDIMILVPDSKGAPVEKSAMNEVFPNQKLVKINWVTGLFVLPVGKIFAYDYNNSGNPIYENYIILEMENGILKREKEFSNEEYEVFNKEQFEAFKETEEYEKLKVKLKRKNTTDEDIDSLIQYRIIEYSTKILVE